MNDFMVGYITTSVTDVLNNPFVLATTICRVGTIVVDQNYPRSGIGKTLMEAEIAWGAEQGKNDVRLEVFDFNKNALDFYE